MSKDVLLNGISDALLNFFFARWTNKKNSDNERKFYEHLFFNSLAGRKVGILKVQCDGTVLQCYIIEKSDESCNISAYTQSGRHFDFKLFVNGNSYCITKTSEFEKFMNSKEKNPPKKDYNYQFTILRFKND